MTEPAIKVRSTKAPTVEREERRWPVQLHVGRTIRAGRTWIFPDGSSTGWYSAVIIRPKVEKHIVTGCRKPPTSSVVAEFDGVILGLSHTVPGEKITIVSDYLWTAYYVNGWWRVRQEALRENLTRVRKLIRARRLTDITFIHYGKEANDRCQFSFWNGTADGLCRERLLLDVRTSLE